MKKLTNKIIIDRFKAIHSDRYDYSDVIYLNRRTKVKINCRIHGQFLMSSENHTSGQGCSKCSDISGGSKRRMTVVNFIKRAISIHGDKYSYDDINLTNQTNKIKLKCNEHGNFYIKPEKLLIGQGCRKCGYSTVANKLKTTQSEFIRKASFVHKNKYGYDHVKYLNSKTNINILCNKCDSLFPQAPNNHLNGSGCPSCQGWIDMSKPAICYYVKLVNENLYKIGVTSKTVEERFSKDKNIDIEVINKWLFDTAIEAFVFERRILSKHNKFRYNGDKVLSSGNTELFIKNILKG